MTRRHLISTAAAILISSLAAFAQSAGEISAAKSMARSYGYSESEIDAVLKHKVGAGGSAAAAAASTAAPAPYESDTTTVYKVAADSADVAIRAKKPQEEKEAPDEKVPAKKAPAEIYGHDFFTSKGLSVIPSYNAPAPASYVLGPGDEVIIDIWGATTAHVAATIGKDGSISVFELGPVYLAGMNVGSAEKMLKTQLSRIYSGLKENDEGADTFLKMSVGKIKGVVISLLGEVRTPGAYTIPSLSSITSAIYRAGGVKENGTVRNIVLYRGGKKAGSFDLYDFIFEGKYDQNLRLQDNDIISVGERGVTVEISGGVLRPMRYELKDSEHIDKAVRYAGGFATDAQKDEVHVERKNSALGEAYDVKKALFAVFSLEDGDKVSVRKNPDLYANRVSISGPVMYEGDYAIGGGITDVRSLVEAAGGLQEGAYTGRGQINRLDENRLPVFITFDLEKVLSGAQKIDLVREDQVILFRQDEFIQEYRIRVSGHVMQPGTFTFREGMTVADAILLARGVRDDAHTERGQISRTDHQGIPRILSFEVNGALDGSNNVLLERGDQIRIYSKRELLQDATVEINGEVQAPGTHPYREGITLEDLLLEARGFTNGADLTNVQIASRGGRQRGTVTMFNLETNPELRSTSLKPYDVVSVKKLPYFKPQTTVTVEGEVLAPGTYVVDKAEVRLSDVFGKVGGFTEEAYVHGARLTRVLTKEEMERQLLAVQIANQNLAGKDTINVTMLADRFNVGIDLEKALAKPGSTDDIVLRAGDIVTVPVMNTTVRVSGGVYYPNTLTYVPGMSWRQYVKMSGNFTRLARRSKTYVVYLNGKVSSMGMGRKIEPGCEIVVPQRQEQDVKPISVSEIAALATSAGSLATMITAVVSLINMTK